MKKRFVCMMVCALVFTFYAAALANSEISNVSFDIATAYLPGVDFTYPVVDLGEDQELNEKINGLIEADAFAPFQDWTEDRGADGGLVTIHQDGDWLSMAYQVQMFSKGAAYPVTLYYTANYDVKNGTRLTLTDMADAGKIAALLLDKGKLHSGLEGVEPEVFQAQAEYISSQELTAIEAMLENDDYQPGDDPSLSQSFFLWGPDVDVYVALSVPHALGDWAVFAFPKAEVAK